MTIRKLEDHLEIGPYDKIFCSGSENGKGGVLLQYQDGWYLAQFSDHGAQYKIRRLSYTNINLKSYGPNPGYYSPVQIIHGELYVLGSRGLFKNDELISLSGGPFSSAQLIYNKQNESLLVAAANTRYIDTKKKYPQAHTNQEAPHIESLWYSNTLSLFRLSVEGKREQAYMPLSLIYSSCQLADGTLFLFGEAGGSLIQEYTYYYEPNLDMGEEWVLSRWQSGLYVTNGTKVLLVENENQLKNLTLQGRPVVYTQDEYTDRPLWDLSKHDNDTALMDDLARHFSRGRCSYVLSDTKNWYFYIDGRLSHTIPGSGFKILKQKYNTDLRKWYLLLREQDSGNHILCVEGNPTAFYFQCSREIQGAAFNNEASRALLYGRKDGKMYINDGQNEWEYAFRYTSPQYKYDGAKIYYTGNTWHWEFDLLKGGEGKSYPTAPGYHRISNGKEPHPISEAEFRPEERPVLTQEKNRQSLTLMDGSVIGPYEKITGWATEGDSYVVYFMKDRQEYLNHNGKIHGPVTGSRELNDYYKNFRTYCPMEKERLFIATHLFSSVVPAPPKSRVVQVIYNQDLTAAAPLFEIYDPEHSGHYFSLNVFNRFIQVPHEFDLYGRTVGFIGDDYFFYQKDLQQNDIARKQLIVVSRKAD